MLQFSALYCFIACNSLDIPFASFFFPSMEISSGSVKPFPPCLKLLYNDKIIFSDIVFHLRFLSPKCGVDDNSLRQKYVLYDKRAIKGPCLSRKAPFFIKNAFLYKKEAKTRPFTFDCFLCRRGNLCGISCRIGICRSCVFLAACTCFINGSRYCGRSG